MIWQEVAKRKVSGLWKSTKRPLERIHTTKNYKGWLGDNGAFEKIVSLLKRRREKI